MTCSGGVYSLPNESLVSLAAHFDIKVFSLSARVARWSLISERGDHNEVRDKGSGCHACFPCLTLHVKDVVFLEGA